MTLIKSILLGSAAGIVAVAGAQAADLPTHKAAPVEYVKVCNVGGITGWTLPGSDTCVKFSGYITAQFTGGNLNTQYNFGSINTAVAAAGYPAFIPGTSIAVGGAAGTTAIIPASALSSTSAGTSTGSAAGGVSTPVTVTVPAVASAYPFNDNQLSQRVLIAASSAQKNTTFFRSETGWTVRANFGFDMASNTAYGPLIGHFDINSENGNGFDNTGGYTYLNTGYLTWAGITAGKAQSFYSFTGGGDNWANFFSPDQKGFNEPDLMAYTASFGGGFTATIAAQSSGCNGGGNPGACTPGGSGGGTDLTEGSLTYGGQKWPDFVGALHLKQGWGEAQVSGVIHNVNVEDQLYNQSTSCGLGGTYYCNYSHQQTGWGVDAGVKINLPSFGAGDDFLVTGSYTQSAVWYSGIPDGMWGENGQVNGNGQPMFMSDAYFNPLTNQWSKPTAWSVTALLEHHFTPQFYVDLEGSVGQLKWSNQGGGCYIYGFGCGVAQFLSGSLSPSATTWIGGADIGWNPVNNLNFDLELMYQGTNQQRPSGFLGTVYNTGGIGGAYLIPGQWHGSSDGFAGRFRITRYF